MFSSSDERFVIIAGGHPVPNQNSILAGQMIEKACQNFAANDLVFCLISGGGSALVTLPVQGLPLPDLQSLTSFLLASGARIDEINTLRRHLDGIKGGGLARMIAPASLISLILSDVVNSPLETIASGPTASDPSTLSDALQVLEKYQLTSRVPESILNSLQNGVETLKQDDPIFDRVQNVLIADNFLAAKAAGEQAQKSGLKTVHLGNSWQGEAREVALELCNNLKSYPDQNLCLIAGGETTVTITGQGTGGRNQELALAAVPELAGMRDVLLVTLATDGEDGPTDAAGAVVSGSTAQRALDAGLNVTEYLKNNDSYHFFEQLGDLLKIGSTGTNVNDLTFLFRF
jgi:hydroxypyruvate reductase